MPLLETWGKASAKLTRTIVLGVTLGIGLTTVRQVHAIGIFGAGEFAVQDKRAYPKFFDMIGRYAEEVRAASASCPQADGDVCSAIADWRDAIRVMTHLSPREQLNAVDRFFDGYRYVSDSENWGEVDYWATPLEFLEFGGDCEDFAVAKYYTLRGLGFDPASLRIVVVQDQRRGIQHAVLAVALQGQVYILDNLSAEVVTAAEVADYRPLMSINELGIWRHF